jgi:hypothetical protein
MKPYGVKIQDRRKMYDYSSDKFNTRGCFNKCNCNLCKTEKVLQRKNTVRSKIGLTVKNAMRVAKKRARQINKILSKNI